MKLGSVSYTLDDIILLENNLTFMIEKDQAKTRRYNKDNKMYTTIFGKVTKIFSLEYIDYFEYFPLIPTSYDDTFGSEEYIAYSIVTGNSTAEMFNEININPIYSKSENLLIKVEENSYISDICRTLQDIYKIEYQNFNEVSRTLYQSVDVLEVNFLKASTILSSIIMILLGYILSENVYSKRKPIIEYEYRTGLSRELIRRNLTFEIFIITIIPVLLSVINGQLFFLLLSKLIIDLQEIYNSFNLWTPWYLIIIMMIPIEILVMIGWIVGIRYKLNKYRAVKEE